MNTRTSVAFLLASLIALGASIAMAADKAPQCPAGMHPIATCANGKVQCGVTDEHRGACSGAGGVASWASGAPVKSHARKTGWAK